MASLFLSGNEYAVKSLSSSQIRTNHYQRRCPNPASKDYPYNSSNISLYGTLYRDLVEQCLILHALDYYHPGQNHNPKLSLCAYRGRGILLIKFFAAPVNTGSVQSLAKHLNFKTKAQKRFLSRIKFCPVAFVLKHNGKENFY